MPITYKVTKCRNPKYPDDNYYTGRAVKTGDYSFEDIAEITTVTKADAMAVLAAMRPKIKKALLAGQLVVLNDLGAFVIGIRGKSYNAATLTDEEFLPASYIKGWSLRFQPEVRLKKEIAKDFKLKRISSDAME
jgi:nucleoid DNA-binding protein